MISICNVVVLVGSTKNLAVFFGSVFCYNVFEEAKILPVLLINRCLCLRYARIVPQNIRKHGPVVNRSHISNKLVIIPELRRKVDEFFIVHVERYSLEILIVAVLEQILGSHLAAGKKTDYRRAAEREVLSCLA